MPLFRRPPQQARGRRSGRRNVRLKIPPAKDIHAAAFVTLIATVNQPGCQRFVFGHADGALAGADGVAGDGLAEFYFDQLQAVVLLKDQPENGQGVLRGGELGVGAQLVGGFPEFVFELLDVHWRFRCYWALLLLAPTAIS